jgi:hypothetical protein
VNKGDRRFYLGVEVEVMHDHQDDSIGWVWTIWPSTGKEYKQWAPQLKKTPFDKEES